MKAGDEAAPASAWNGLALPIGAGIFSGLFVCVLTVKPLVDQYGPDYGTAAVIGLAFVTSLVTIALCLGIGRLTFR